MEKYYVLQRKKYPWDDKHWITNDWERYGTAQEAERARLGKVIPGEWRVAEAYVQIRYKPVKVE